MTHHRPSGTSIGPDGISVHPKALPFGRTLDQVQRTNLTDNWRMDVERSLEFAGKNAHSNYEEGSEVRLQRIARLKAEIAAGRYFVSSADLAQRLFDKMLGYGGSPMGR